MLAGYRNHIFFTDPWGLVPLVILPNKQLTMFLYHLFYICVLWGLVNLLPIYPLDGGQMARELIVKLNPREGIRQSLLLSIIAAVVMAAYGLSRQDWFIALLFGYFAYSSYAILQAYGGHREL